jgi:predicted small secreted protein
MRKLITPILVLAALAVVLAGCGNKTGGGGGISQGGSDAGAKSTGGVNGISVGDCLNAQDFLVQPTEKTLDGQSPAGVVFTLTLYKDEAAAKAVADTKSKKTTALVENGVVDFRGNPSIYAGAPPAKISPVEIAAIKGCIDKGKE